MNEPTASDPTEDAALLALLSARMDAGDGKRHDLDDVIAELGFTREEIEGNDQ